MKLGELIRSIVLQGKVDMDNREWPNYIRIYEHGVVLEDTFEQESVEFSWKEVFEMLWWFPPASAKEVKENWEQHGEGRCRA